MATKNRKKREKKWRDVFSLYTLYNFLCVYRASIYTMYTQHIPVIRIRLRVLNIPTHRQCKLLTLECARESVRLCMCMCMWVCVYLCELKYCYHTVLYIWCVSDTYIIRCVVSQCMICLCICIQSEFLYSI